MASDPSSALGRLGSMTLPRQMSIYSLTLDEFQNALGEPGKNFGSMNMDELLKNIWTAEESQAMTALFNDNDQAQSQQQPDMIGRQSSFILRQNSVTLLPLPQELSKKTVDEVWKNFASSSSASSMSMNQAQQEHQQAQAQAQAQAQQQQQQQLQQNFAELQAAGGPIQGSYGEMTLEDFLIKAGVMAADAAPAAAAAPAAPQGFDYGSGAATMTAPVSKSHHPHHLQPILGGMIGKREQPDDVGLGIGLGGGGGGASTSYGNGTTSYGGGNANGATTSYGGSMAAKQQAEWMENQYKSSTALAHQQHIFQLQAAAAAAAAYGGGSAAAAAALGGLVGYPKEGSPGSPLSDAHGYGNGITIGLDAGGGGIRGRKRILDAPLEKIVERRQRRMIKNRESAARSRARKQAYTVELEAEVTQLKEENMKLRKMQEEENLRKRKQVIGSMSQHLPKALRRTVTGPW